jgi:hypothetical protein
MVELLKNSLELIETAIKNGDWKPDGACDPDSIIQSLNHAIKDLESQEPVAWVKAHQGGVLHDINMPVAQKLPKGVRFDVFTHPPQRTWVGLTPEEILDVFDAKIVYGSKWLEFAKAVENKLKEKNT